MLKVPTCLNSVSSNVKAVVAASNQEKAPVGAFSVIVQPVVEPMDRFTALIIIVHRASSLPQDGLLCVWDLLTGACMYSVQAHSARVADIAYSPGCVVTLGEDDK